MFHHVHTVVHNVVYSSPDVMMEAYSKEPATPLIFIIYLVLTVYLVDNIVGFSYKTRTEVYV